MLRTDGDPVRYRTAQNLGHGIRVFSMDLYGDTLEDFAAVKVKNSLVGSKNPRARYRKCFTAEDVAASAMVADPLRLMDIRATSDGGAAIIVSSLKYAREMGKGNAPRVAAISLVTPTFASSVVEMPDIDTYSAAAAGVTAQALSQVCELTWQLRGQAGDRLPTQGSRCLYANRNSKSGWQKNANGY